MRRVIHLILVLLCLMPLGRAAPAAGDPTLTIQAGKTVAIYTRLDLLGRPDLETLTVEHDPAYPGRTMTYTAVKATTLFAGVPLDADAVIEFKCLDGFAAPLSKERLLDRRPGKAVAYIAVEDPAAPWPPLKPGGGPSAGPFYLVWSHPEASFIGQEEWPFQLAALDVKGSLRGLYPKIYPAADADAHVRRGFEVFSKTCFSCHTLNKSGASEIGPDLNVPLNPTDYLMPAALRLVVRNPQSLRYFPKSRMSAFPKDVLPDADLDDVIAYLRHMAKRKVQ